MTKRYGDAELLWQADYVRAMKWALMKKKCDGKNTSDEALESVLKGEPE